MFRNKSLFTLVLAVFLVLLGSGVAEAQRKRTTKRTVPPPTSSTDPNTGEVRIVSTADSDTDPTPDTSRRTGRTRTTTNNTEPQTDPAPTTISGLSRQVNSLSQRIKQMEASQRSLVDLERLTRAEARADSLRIQLFAAQDRETALQGRLEELNYDLLPENIENIGALNGSTRPELVREQRRRYLEAEKAKATAQLSNMSLNRNRLEGAVASADALVDKLRRTVEAEGLEQESMPTPAGSRTPDTTAPVDANGADQPEVEPENVPTDAELVRMIKGSLADLGITSVSVEAANGAIILSGDIPSAKVPTVLKIATDAHPRKIYNQMTVK
ncbi:MAG: hypothetical protein ABIP75_11895 [Pyrinomonadaceae bacterium]